MAISSWFSDQGIEADEVRRRFFQKLGYGGVDDLGDDVRDRWGEEERARFYRDLQDDRLVAQWNDGDRRRRAAGLVAPFHAPTALYLDYVEEAVARYVESFGFDDVIYSDYVQPPVVTAARHVNEVFEARGIVYRLDEHGLAQWHGDEGAYREVVRPALDALADLRLEAAGREYGDALAALRRGDRVGVKNAIRDASNAVETTMKGLLDAHRVQRPERETADSLWDALRAASVVAEKTKEEVCGPSHLRNTYGGHGPDPARDEPVPEGVASLAVMTAGAAILYLASLLPT
jgi:hypothetical protein